MVLSHTLVIFPRSPALVKKSIGKIHSLALIGGVSPEVHEATLVFLIVSSYHHVCCWKPRFNTSFLVVQSQFSLLLITISFLDQPSPALFKLLIAALVTCYAIGSYAACQLKCDIGCGWSMGFSAHLAMQWSKTRLQEVKCGNLLK